jgi:hypothetical protein
MLKTSELLTSILIISIIVFLLVFYKDKICNNKYINNAIDVFNNIFNAGTFKTNAVTTEKEYKESTDNLFATEYEVSEAASVAISDALKEMETE